MKAILFAAYGPPEGLKLVELPEPEPGPMGVVVRVHATTVTAGDTEIRRLKLPLMLRLPLQLYAGLFRPKRIRTLGMEFAGTVARVGEKVAAGGGPRGELQVGDEIFGTTGFGFGAYAECIRLSNDATATQKPRELSFADVAPLPTGGNEALFFVRTSRLQAGEKILVYGASGSIGTYLVQLAAGIGADVTAVCGPATVELMLELGATVAYPYTDPQKPWRRQKYDVFVDSAAKGRFFASVSCVRRGGRYHRTNPGMGHLLGGLLVALFGGRRISFASAKESVADLDYLKGLLVEGKLRTVIDKTFALEDMAAAHAHVDTGQKVGNVVIEVTGSERASGAPADDG